MFRIVQDARVFEMTTRRLEKLYIVHYTINLYGMDGQLFLLEDQIQKSAKTKGHMIVHMLNFIIIN